MLIAPCDDYDVNTISLLWKNGPPDSLNAWRISGPWDAGSPGSMELLSPPPAGWTTDEQTLTEPNSAGRYTAVAYGDVHGRRLDGHVTFKAKDLEALSAGKVITGFDGDQIVSREKFLKGGPDRCKPSGYGPYPRDRPTTFMVSLPVRCGVRPGLCARGFWSGTGRGRGIRALPSPSRASSGPGGWGRRRRPRFPGRRLGASRVR